MSDLEWDCLRILRVFGPCSNADVGRKLGIAPDKTYPAVKTLELMGLVVHPGKQRWSISRFGLEWLGRNGLNTIALFTPPAPRTKENP